MSNLRRTLEAVEQNPGHYDQRVAFHGPTKLHCFFGFADLLMSGYAPNKRLAMSHCKPTKVEKWLGITAKQGDDLAFVGNSIDDIRRIVAEIEAENAK
jgi:hypothetical protein